MLPGAAAFKLYDTYGLALEEQEEMAREFGLQIDHDSFNAEMEKQKALSRASWKGADKANIADVYKIFAACRIHWTRNARIAGRSCRSSSSIKPRFHARRTR